MGLASASVTVYNGEDQEPVVSELPIHLLTWLSTADSRNVVVAGGKILAYNGEVVNPVASNDPTNYQNSGFNEADFKKIASGAYSAWSYQHLYYHGSLNAGETEWYGAMKSTWIPQGLQITSNGLRLEDMACERPDDGFPIFAL
jgi:hypothetical protein